MTFDNVPQNISCDSNNDYYIKVCNVKVSEESKTKKT